MSQILLRFTPYAFAKMVFLRDRESNLEVGGFGVSDADDLLLVRDIVLPHQTVSAAAVNFDEDKLPGFYEDMVDAGMSLPQFSRIWIHTHPFDGATPSAVDESTFRDVFGNNDWAVMFILANSGKTTSRFRANVSQLNIEQDINWRIEWKTPFPAADPSAWEQEYVARVVKRTYYSYTSGYNDNGPYYGGGMHPAYGEGGGRYARGFRGDDDDLPGSAFQKERRLLERAAKKGGSGASGGGVIIRSTAEPKSDEPATKLAEQQLAATDDLSEWDEYHKLQLEDEDLTLDAPFSLSDDIPWIL